MRRHHVFGPLLFVLPALFAACGGSTTSADPAAGGDDAGVTDDAAPQEDAGPVLDYGAPSDTYPAPHPALPQVVSGGGPILTAPRVVPIFYPGYTHKAEVLDYLSKIGDTPYWSANVSEYGVGKLTAGDPIELTGETAPTSLSDDDIKAFLVSRLDGTHTEFGTPDPQTIYTLFYPSTTTITLGGGFGGQNESCQSFGGYHDAVSIGGTYTAYAVIPECKNFGGLTGVNVLSSTSSHEWIEAATDPHPTNDPAFGQVDDDHLAWTFFLGGGETGDMCAQDATSFYQPDGFPYFVQRSWSNAAAAAGKDPCVPGLTGEPYFNSAPVLNDALVLSGGGQTVKTKGIKLAVGETKTVEVDLFSEAKTSGPWTVSARELSFGSKGTLDVSLDRKSGVNGQKMYMTVTATAKSPYGASLFVITSKLGSRESRWVGFVGN